MIFLRLLGVTSVTIFIGIFFLFYTGPQQNHSIPGRKAVVLFPHNRKLLDHVVHPNRIGESCSKDDIVVYQGASAPLPNGIPTFTVEIHNVCVSGCSISDIRVNCGWFSSARLINPRVFKRLSFNDCLVYDGKVLANGGSLSFQYANSFRYPLSVSSVICH